MSQTTAKIVDTKNQGHEAGRFIVINVPAENMQFTFSNNESKNIHSLVIWTEGSKQP